LAALEDRTLLGRGLVVPFRRDKRHDFHAASGAELVRSAISQVLAVRADNGRMTGELPWRPEFGSLLYSLQHTGVDEVFAALARSRVVSAISQWEPRARVTSTQVLRVTDTAGQVTALLRVTYDLVQVGSQNVLTRNQQLDVPLTQ
jgi:phage baseplate assembly protein W